MTGTIIGLITSTRSGTIGLLDGSRVAFQATEVLGEFETLAVGQRVSFDFDRRFPSPHAARVMREPVGPGVPRKPGAPPDLRYSGFDQALNVRAYRFRTAEDGHLPREFVVRVDMKLLLEHHVNVQEVPALCLRRLTTDLKDNPENASHDLEREDLLAYLASRPEGAMRGRPKPRSLRRVPPRPDGILHAPESEDLLEAAVAPVSPSLIR